MPSLAGKLAPDSANIQQQIQIKKTGNERGSKRQTKKFDGAEKCICHSKKSVQKPKQIEEGI